ncbi:phage distal tail protein [Arthrobacter sp. N1]|uniref:phage distal tail protein n=1 Tax=Arthrobacter sp. N1 TaxID=619291 RepID=UPI003BAFC98B
MPGSVVLNGLPLHGPDTYGAVWKVNDIEHWLDPAETTGTVEQREHADGGFTTPSYFKPKTVILKGRVSAPDRRGVLAALDRLSTAIPKSVAKPLVVGDADGLTHRLVRQSGQPIFPKPTERFGRFNIELVAPDHRRFSGDGAGPTYSVTVGLPSQMGGLVLPAAPPWTINATVVSGSVIMTNRGNTAPPALVRIEGPVSKPVISTDDGQSMPFDMDLTEGQFLLVDLDLRTVLLNGQAPRRGALRAQWINLSPGTNTLRFDAAAYNDQARMTVTWSDSWK